MKTKNELKHHKQFHKYTSDDKLKWLGNGEWVEEPDLCCFKYNNYSCYIWRQMTPTAPNHIFGGHLCGYIKLNISNKYYGLKEDEIRDAFNFHWGVTWDEIKPNYSRIIGFDCAHSGDLVPSMIETNSRIKKDYQERYPALSRYSSSLFSVTYKNIKFVENSLIECIDNL